MTLRTLIAAHILAFAAAGLSAQTFDPASVTEDLSSADTRRVQNARDDAVAYLGNPGLSVSDRLAAVQALDAPIAEAAESDDEFVVTNALLIAGQFVTPTGFQILTDHLDADSPSIRYAAYRGLRSSFAILADQSAPSLQPSAAQSAFSRLVEAVGTESDANTLEAGYRAIAEALTVTASPLKPLESAAGVALGRLAADRMGQLDALDESDYAPTLGSSLYAALEYRRLLSTAGRRIDDATARSAAALAGEIIGHAYAQFEAAGGISNIDPDRRELVRQALSTAESVAYLALGRLNADPTQTNLAGAFQNADDRAFRADAFRLIGPAGSIRGAGVELSNAPSGG